MPLEATFDAIHRRGGVGCSQSDANDRELARIPNILGNFWFPSSTLAAWSSQLHTSHEASKLKHLHPLTGAERQELADEDDGTDLIAFDRLESKGV
jgi:hypothetical protein